MATLTINARVDLTYEEIYEGYANGKSRLPKIIKEIEAGDNALAEDVGIDILRRRTGGGNAEDVSTVGVTNTTVVARLISAARFDALISGYSGSAPFINPPSANIQTVDVRGVTKNPFDLIDQVSGINNSEQSGGSARNVNALSGREAKFQELGTGVRIKEIDTRLQESLTGTIDVTDFFTDLGGSRIGGGGATGEIHGVDLGIPEVVVMDTEATVRGDAGATFEMSPDLTLGLDVDGVTVSVVFPAATLTITEIADTINTAVDATLGVPVCVPANDPVAVVESPTQLALHSRLRGILGTIDISEGNIVLGLTGDSGATGDSVGEVTATTNQEVVEMTGDNRSARARLRYGTVQFGVIQIVATTSGLEAAGIAANVGTTPVAYILHPDHLADLIAH